MNQVRSIVFILLVAFLSLAPLQAFSKAMPKDVVQGYFKTLEMFKGDDSQLLTTVEPFWDFDLLTARSLGDLEKKITKKQEAEYRIIFRKLIGVSYIERSKTALQQGGIKVSRDKEIVKNQAVVMATVADSQVDTKIIFRLHRMQKNWLIYDMEIDGFSITESLKTQNAMLTQKHGFEYVLERMRSAKEGEKGKEAKKKSR